MTLDFLKKNQMRLARYLASCGLGSRRACENIIKAGAVELNGNLVTKVESDIDASKDTIFYNGRKIGPKNLVYYLVNKPTGYTASRQDLHASRIITDLVPTDPPVWPIGRLDRETSGLILLTNDGDLTYRLTHPKFLKEKEYIVNIDSNLSNNEVDKIRAGVILKDGLIKPDSFEKISPRSYRITIHEGRKRIIRRLISHFGKEVIALKRLRVDSIELDDLQDGQYRDLTAKEVTKLKTND